jgi:hypothetical protein
MMIDRSEDGGPRPALRIACLAMALVAGCGSPEDGRERGGSAGGDGGNYAKKPVHAPSKIDDTKSLPREPR